MPTRILVIDDDPAIRRSFELALEDGGYVVDTADSGAVGVNLLEEGGHDLIFLDLNMPGMDGVETLRRLRGLSPDVPVFIVTAFYKEYFTDLKKAAADGLDFELLQKPVDLDQIALVADSVLKGARTY